MCNDVRLPSNAGDDPLLTTVSDKQSSVKQVAEPVLNDDAPSVSWSWKEEDIDAPTSEFGTYPLLFGLKLIECFLSSRNCSAGNNSSFLF